jgi:hypothetical protein
VKDLIEIRVECYSGYKADEYPVRFYWDDMKFEIKEILDQWYHRDPGGYSGADYFKVSIPDDKVFILKHELEEDKWYLWIRGESLSLLNLSK